MNVPNTPTTPTSANVPITSAYLVVDSPHELARWRPLVNWVLFIPHAIISSALEALASVAFLVYWLTFVFTGRQHPGLYGAMVMYERYNVRASGFLVGYSQVYPPYDFDTGANDNGAYSPVRLSLPDVPAATPRSAALNLLKGIPHYLMLVVYFAAAAAVALVAWFAVLFTGRWPQGMRRFLVRVANYYFRIWTYVTMVDNSYPKFTLPTN